MSTEVKNIILLGGTSVLGKGFVEYLNTIDHPFTVTITSREPKLPSWVPSNDPRFKHVDVDFNSNESLLSALKGQDAAVALLAAPLLDRQPAILDAAIEAGVKIFIPAEFGLDTSSDNPNLKYLLTKPVSFFKVKHDNNVHLRKRVDEGKISSIRIVNSVFFDWGLPIGFLGFNLKDKKAKIYDGGDVVVNSITTSKLGQAIALVLLKPKPYLNRSLQLTTLKYTQNELLRILEDKTSSKYEIENASTEGTIAFGEELAKSDPQIGGYVIIGASLYDDKESLGPRYTRKDAEELGLEEDDVATVVGRVLSAA